MGDLPLLVVDADGTATTPVVAPRLRVDAIRGLALMIHAQGDNYSDDPAPLGGGGARIACGIIR
jgi:Cu-Zn family superoxide dismutase